MESVTEGQVPWHARAAGTTAVGWQIVWFLLHVAVVYAIANFCTPWLAGWTRGRLLPLLQMRTNSSSRFEFLFSHLLVFSLVPAFLAGLINARLQQRVSQFVWLVPTAILVYKLATFPTTSVLQSHFVAVFHQYFGGGFLIPEFRDWHEFRSIVYSNPDMTRGMAQIRFTAPFYASVGYSVAAWIGRRMELHRKITEAVDSWGDSRPEQGS